MFRDRAEAGRRLAERLSPLRGEDVVVVGLPRGGVPVAYEVALRLAAPLDVLVVRKLGVPFQPELAMGAIGEDGVTILNRRLVQKAGVSEDELAAIEVAERKELERRIQRFRSGRARVRLSGRVVVVVDDGIATGATARAACQVVRAAHASRVILAVPVAPAGWRRRLADAADELVSLSTPRSFLSVGQFYEDFTQVTDEQVVACLGLAAARPAGSTAFEPRAGSQLR